MEFQITKGKLKKAKKVVIYGAEGIGKSTLAAKFPKALFIDTEGSTANLDISRLPTPTSWSLLLEEIKWVYENPESCKSLVIDTIDWAESLCVEHILSVHNKKGIEDFGYGNGYIYVKEEFGRFLNKLTDLIEKGINVVLTAHAQLRKFEQPDELGAYDRWELKLGKKTSSQTSPLVKEWADMLLFCNYKTVVVNVDGQGSQKGKNKAQGGKRVIYTAHHICWDAKNRYGLPEEIDMDYNEIKHVIEDVVETENIKESGKVEIEEPKKKDKEIIKKEEKNEERITGKEEIKTNVPHEEEVRKEPENIPKDDGFVTVGGGVNRYLSDRSRIPKALTDLMEAEDVTEWEIQQACASRGYIPSGTLIQNMDPGFVEGVLIGAWEQVLSVVKMIKKDNEIPFN